MDDLNPATQSEFADSEPAIDFLAAEEAVARLSRAYPDRASRDLAQARDVLERLAGGVDPGADLECLREYAHNAKGQGGSFGFALASDIAALLSNFLAKIDAPTPLQRRTIAAHLDALRVVFRRRITGHGGEMGHTLLTRLRQIGATTAPDPMTRRRQAS